MREETEASVSIKPGADIMLEADEVNYDMIKIRRYSLWFGFRHQPSRDATIRSADSLEMD